MTFKKDYINYLLYTVVNSAQYEFVENYRLRKLVDSITAIDDVMKITYLIGKTAGLENLFKYLLYISDKIDKSQVTIFNLKDNFEYDKINLAKICRKIIEYQSENVQEAIQNITEEKAVITESKKEAPEDIFDDETVTEELTEQDNITEIDVLDGSDAEDEEEGQGLTLIENVESYTGGAEVFELESISESVESSGDESAVKETTDEGTVTGEENSESEDEEDDITGNEIVDSAAEVFDLTEETSQETSEKDEVIPVEESDKVFQTASEDLPEIEIEIHKPMGVSNEVEHVKEEAITNEAYYTFETKFFEEVKILEKLLATVNRDCKTDAGGKLSEKCLQSLTEIIGISSELSNLSRQLSFDLTADVFFTMNMYFTKAISQPEILTGERINLLDSSLALVNSLIKGEDYLNYDTVVDRIENLKKEITKAPEEKPESELPPPVHNIEAAEQPVEESTKEEVENTGNAENISPRSEEKQNEKTAEIHEEGVKPKIIERPGIKQSQIESAQFKLKYLIKEFEKSFTGIDNLKGEYSKFDAIEKISELNNALRLIAKIAASIRMPDVLKLAEVTYVFLKYVKDYRMDLQEPEIRQIVKYIIFTFKMLLTNRKPEDFNVLVQHLNNPVKIFADS
jgi:hypothetical protein